MSALARGLFVARRRLGERLATFVVLATWSALALGVLSTAALARGDLAATSAVAVVAATLVWTVARELTVDEVVPRATLRELELGLVLATALYVLLALTGGARSFLYPLVYALVSFLVIVARSGWTTAAVLTATIGLELILASHGQAARPWATFGQHVTFIAFFAAGNRLVLVGVVRRLRRDHTARVQGEIGRMRQEARDFRLIASQLPLESRTRSRDEEELRMAVAAVETIHEQLFHALDLLRSALGLHTCALLWCEDPPPGARPIPQLAMKELSTASELVIEGRVLPTAGLLTAVLADPKPLRLHALAGRRLPPYYAGPESVTDLCAVPLVDGGILRGILCADRLGDRPFSDDDERVLVQAALQLRRVIEHERTFLAVERGKYEQEQFYRASDMLASALAVEQVYEKTFAAVRAIAAYDLAVVTGGEGQEHTVLAVDAPGGAASPWSEVAEQLHGLRFTDPHSLVGMAIKNRHHMPASGDLVDEDTIVFNGRTRLRGLKSLLVLPLVRGEEVLGAVALASARPGVFPAATREMLRVIGHQAGQSLQNARMYRLMEQRATTDGLTGLTNHRAFQERLAHLHALAERTGQKYALVLTDIDHFKSINDTYGHPVGDQVLKKVAALFAGRARKVDIVARYGGEEFVLVLPDTDGAGAEHVATKLREEVGEAVMTSEHGTFKITISMGIAEYPCDGHERLELVEKADQALYWCKEHGRNRVRRFAQT